MGVLFCGLVIFLCFAGTNFCCCWWQKFLLRTFLRFFFKQTFSRKGEEKFQLFTIVDLHRDILIKDFFISSSTKPKENSVPDPCPILSLRLLFMELKVVHFWRVFICKNFPLILKIISAVLLTSHGLKSAQFSYCTALVNLSSQKGNIYANDETVSTIIYTSRCSLDYVVLS